MARLLATTLPQSYLSRQERHSVRSRLTVDVLQRLRELTDPIRSPA